MPDTDTRLGSKLSAESAAGAACFFPLLKTTPISLARISFPSRMSSSVGELMILLSCAMRKRLEKTENCTTRSRTSSRDAEPDANHDVYGLWTTIGCSPTFLSARAANGERSWSS